MNYTYIVYAAELHTGRMREQDRFCTYMEAWDFAQRCKRWSDNVRIERTPS